MRSDLRRVGTRLPLQQVTPAPLCGHAFGESDTLHCVRTPEPEAPTSVPLVMKIIFLDIDGVLNCDKTPNPRKFPYIVDKKLLARLKKLLDRTGAKVVLSSSWRCDPVGLFAAKHSACRSSACAPTSRKARAARRCLPGFPLTPGDAICGDRRRRRRTGRPAAVPAFSQDRPHHGDRQGAEKYLNGESDETMRASAVVRLGQNIHSLFKRNKS